MKNTNTLHKAALAFEKAIRKYIAFTMDDETYEFRKDLDFGTVTVHCVNGEATLWVTFPDKSVTHFELARLDKRLLWIYHEQPKITHTTLELFRGLSMWWGAIQWLEGMKDKEEKK